MGAALAQTVLGVERPRVGLLSNGEEAARGSALVVEAHAELRERAMRRQFDAFEFVGNVEGGDVVSGRADVIVTDGFTGQHRAEADGGRLADDARRDPRGGDVLDARRSSAACCCAARCGAFARRSTRRPAAAPTCSACAGWAWCRTGASRARASRRRSCAPSAARARTSSRRPTRALEQPRARSGARPCPRRPLACRTG